MSRAVTILYIVFCFEIGLFLLIFPWVSLWHKNFFVNHYPWVSSIAKNYFVRGGISGIGLADLILAVSELWRRYRQRQSPVNVRSSR